LKAKEDAEFEALMGGIESKAPEEEKK